MKNVHYEFVALPFGLAVAPRKFTAIVKEFKKIAIEHGFRVNQYLDDWINRTSVIFSRSVFHRHDF